MKDRDVIYLDLETGGLNSWRNPIIEVGAVAVCNGQETGRYHAKVQFNEEECHPKALATNGYEPALWADAKPLAEVLDDFNQFCGAHSSLDKISKRTGNSYQVALIAGHNVKFDLEFLRTAYKKADRFMPANYLGLDTAQLAMWIAHRDSREPDEGFSLGALCKFYGLPEPHPPHSAMGDAVACARLAMALMASMEEEPWNPEDAVSAIADPEGAPQTAGSAGDAPEDDDIPF